MDFKIVGEIYEPETFAQGSGIREGNWRKRKAYARVLLPDGSLREAEIHWYEASGIGKREFKIKRYLET
jgi:hypothetical protein